MQAREIDRLRTYFNATSVAFSPWQANVFAVSSSQHFGMSGKGVQQVFRQFEAARAQEIGEKYEEIARFTSPSAIYDCCFSESKPDLMLSACGDGCIRAWSIERPEECLYMWNSAPASKELQAVQWSFLEPNKFFSGGWDSKVRVWSTERLAPLLELDGHSFHVYDVSPSPFSSCILASSSGDGSLKIWDARIEGSRTVENIVAHGGTEVLSVDFDKYDSNLVYSGGVDASVRSFDLRRPLEPYSLCVGHGLAVKCVRASPFQRGVVASVSYDMNTIVWETLKGVNPLVHRLRHHSEFATYVAWSLHCAGRLATTSWDCTAAIIEL